MIAVLIPCRNEEATIATVVKDFQRVLPAAAVYVYDNGSTDRTAEVARDAGAMVRTEPRPGKGRVVRRMFADVDADVYVLVDGDATYDAGSAPAMIERLVDDGLDMVIGSRQPADGRAYRPGHRLGNRFLTGLVTSMFGSRFTDLLSGYRVFSRRYVKTFPGEARGFAIETELAVHALQLELPVAEHPVPYVERPEGSTSKLSTVGDGLRILSVIGLLVKEERPLLFFSGLAALLAVTALVLAYPVVVTYLETGLVPRFPTAILATGLMILAWLSLASGIILDSVSRGRREMRRLHYLAHPAARRTPTP